MTLLSFAYSTYRPALLVLLSFIIDISVNSLPLKRVTDQHGTLIS
jgi:hypothetical protein